MEQVKQITVEIDGDITDYDEETATQILMEKFEEQGYIPADRPVVVRVGKVSSIRAVEKESHEEVEIYTVAQVINKNGAKKTVITGRVI
ncbi:MAG: hypothetical protein Q9M89_00725 [Persephonella sp.]|nr:hypothetical protein [Persephonella sp.]